MALYRPTFTKPIPPMAELLTRKGERIAKWKDGRGRWRTAKVTTTKAGEDRLLFQSPIWRCRYRDGSGNVRDVSTGCKDEVAAKGAAARHERRAELVKAEVITASEDATADHAVVPLPQHFDRYEQHLKAGGGDRDRIKMVRARLDRIAADCHWSRLSDLKAEPFVHWLVARKNGERRRRRETAIARRWCFSLIGASPATG